MYAGRCPCHLCDDDHEVGEPCYPGAVEGLLIGLPIGLAVWMVVYVLFFR